jgi:4-hydroxy-tetrahydrodipicolinate synthase
MQPGVTALFVNGHAGEVATLTDDERGEVVRVARATIGPDMPLMAGIVADSTWLAVRFAEQARDAGADALTVFPPAPFGAAGALRGDMAFAYFRAIDAAVNMPLAVFQYPLQSAGYDTATLVRLAGIQNVIAVKEGSDSMLAYEQNWRALKAARPDLQVLPSNYDWFLAQLAVGSDGLLSGLAGLVPDLLADFWHATQRADLRAMRELNDRLWPLVQAIYAPPRVEIHARIKTALTLLGIIERDLSRPPILPVSTASVQQIRDALIATGLLPESE